MDVIFTHGAGLDVYKKSVMACRMTTGSDRATARGSRGDQGL